MFLTSFFLLSDEPMGNLKVMLYVDDGDGGFSDTDLDVPAQDGDGNQISLQIPVLTY